MSGTAEATEKSLGRFARVSTLGFLILGYIAYDNLNDPFVTYSPVTTQAPVHSGVGFLLAAGSLIANVLAYRADA